MPLPKRVEKPYCSYETASEGLLNVAKLNAL